MTVTQKINLGWDKPLDVDWNFQLGILRKEIAAAAPGKSGALKHAFDSEDTAVMSSPTTIEITVGKQHKAWPYASIQNLGGPSHDIKIFPKKPGGVLRFMWNGQLRFFKYVTMHAGQIHPTNFVQNGVYNWWRKLMRGITDGGAPVYQWASGHHSQGAERMSAKRGRVSR